MQGLTNDLVVLGEERVHIRHITCDERRCAALREPSGVDLLVHIAQSARIVDDKSALVLSALEDVGRIDVFGIEGWVLAHQDRIEIAQALQHRIAELEPAGRILENLQWASAAERDTIAQHQVTHFEVAQIESVGLRREQHRERRILAEFDVGDGVHHHGEGWS